VRGIGGRLVAGAAVAVVVFALGGGAALGAVGGLDPGFGSGGTVVTPVGGSDDVVTAVALQPDGKIVAAGYMRTGAENSDFALVRYDPGGTLDTGFGSGGKVTTSLGAGIDVAFAVAVQPDGKIVAAGYSHNGSNFDFALARYNRNGSLDRSFDGDGKVTTPIRAGDDIAHALALQPDGKIVVAGDSFSGSNDDFALARYNSDGSLDTGFHGTGKVTTAIGAGNDSASAVAVQSDGKIVVAGYTLSGSVPEFALARYGPAGSLDRRFGVAGTVTTPIGHGAHAWALALQPDGKIVAAGDADNGSDPDFALARYAVDGGLDATFDGDGTLTTPIGPGEDRALAVAAQPDGKIVAAGRSVNGSNRDFALARYEGDGSLDASFDGDGIVTTAIGPGNDDADAVVLQPDGKIVAGGDAQNASDYDFALARYCGGEPCDAAPATIKVQKVLAPSGDAGRFSLLVDSRVVKVAARDGGAGSAAAAAGLHMVGEIAAAGALADYATSISCTRNGAPDVSGDGTSIDLTVAFGDVESCTITNKRKATVTLRKALSPASDPGRFNLRAGSRTLAAAVGDGGSGTALVAPGTVDLSETAASGPGLSAYSSSIVCTRNGSPGPSGVGTTLHVRLAPADVLDCTFTNKRNG